VGPTAMLSVRVPRLFVPVTHPYLCAGWICPKLMPSCGGLPAGWNASKTMSGHKPLEAKALATDLKQTVVAGVLFYRLLTSQGVLFPFACRYYR
jgi:hypothetical protein